jgi:hypothetical protein
MAWSRMDNSTPTWLGRLRRRLGLSRFKPETAAEKMGIRVVHGTNWSYAVAFPSRSAAEAFALLCRQKGFPATTLPPESQACDVLFKP